MPDDKSISQLVTKSLRLELTEAELKQVNQNLESNKEAARITQHRCQRTVQTIRFASDRGKAESLSSWTAQCRKSITDKF